MRSHEPRSSSSCAACKFLKRRCVPNCIFAPYFRSDEPKKFARVHKVFGASNVSKILTEVPEEQREDTVNSLAYEAEARLSDPVYGCIGAIALLQRKMVELQHDLAVAKARLARCYATSNDSNIIASNNSSNSSAGTNLLLGCNYSGDPTLISDDFSALSGFIDSCNQNNSSLLFSTRDGINMYDISQFSYN
ncbi:LOB domain-containing protein 21-like [Rutidosis leptorrhynchoides]|uniref:LOB domain-containing protein 21-like n=1 Tax=Rutidosis leptorrhynchoides TaxID=125765 RepID=UPI003A98EE8C